MNCVWTEMVEMFEKFKKVFKCLARILKLFLSYGDVVPEVNWSPELTSSTASRSVAPRHVFNGVITSVQLVVLVLTTAFCVLMAPSMAQVKVTNMSSQMTLLILMIAGMIVMIGFYCYQDRLLKRRDKPNSVKDRLTLGGIVIFYVFGCVLDFFHLIKLYYCRYYYQLCGSIMKHSISAAFHAFRILYLGTETMFCVMFRRASFFDRCIARYGLMLIQATNLALWFDMLVRESKHRIRRSILAESNINNASGSVKDRCYAALLNSSSPFESSMLRCYAKNTTFHAVLDSYIDACFSPFSYEMSILVGECLFEWFLHCRSTPKTNTRHGGSDSNTLDTTATSSNPSVETSFTSSTGKFLNRKSISCPIDRGSSGEASQHNSSRRRARNNDINSSQGSRSSSDTSAGNISSSSNSNSETWPLLSSPSRPASHSMTHLLLFLAGILLNLIYCIFSFVPLLLNDTETRRFHAIYFYYSTFYWTSITLAIFIGYYCSQSFQLCNKKLHSLDYILMFSSIGPYTYVVTALVVIVRQMRNPAFEGEYELYPVFYIILEATYLASIYFQIPFTFQTGRVVIPPTDGCPTRDGKVSIFKAILIHLAICNGTTWFVDTFATAYNATNLFIQTRYFDQNAWVLLNTFITPLILFFRFNSCVLFVSAYLRFKKLFQQVS